MYVKDNYDLFLEHEMEQEMLEARRVSRERLRRERMAWLEAEFGIEDEFVRN